MGHEPTAIIVAVGTELLKGIVLDTNSHWLAQRLTSLGIKVKRIIIVPDDVEEIGNVVKESMRLADVLLVTGGLGFTEDDVTLQGVAKALGTDLELSNDALEMIKRRIGNMDYTRFTKAAFIPRGGIPLLNEVGISPGVLMKVDNKVIAVMPGVPAEMKTMFQKHVEPILLETYRMTSRTMVIITGHLVEAEVDDVIKELRRKYPEAYFKTHAETPVKISITITGRNEVEVDDLMRKVIEDLKKVLIIREILTE